MVLSGAVVHDADTSVLLRGFTKDSSGFSDRFCVVVFVQPLFVPRDHLVFSYGGRLGRRRVGVDHWWSTDAAQRAAVGDEIACLLREVGVPWLQSHADLGSLADSILRMPGFEQDVNHLEVLAGAAVLTRNTELAQLAFSSVNAVAPSAPWEREVKERVVHLEHMWTKDLDLAAEELSGRARETAVALRVR